MAKPPSPGDDATPFLLRCYAKPGPFRPVQDFESGSRAQQDEYKLYVWKTTTLREVAQMLHEANPSLSQPLSLHAFRLIHVYRDRSRCSARSVGGGVTRVPLRDMEDLMDGIELDTATKRAIESLREESDESVAKRTLHQLAVQDGDLLDCTVKADPTIPTAPAAPRLGPGGHGPGRSRRS
ncbi:uncharacterized protein PFL1_04219 [Pseudozyma flocculosa PF-1]|uniref:Histone deacetylase complex subunit SAP18 n=2 Tax=Pseudozyma flocculosa TaxID=84751 RepID=A0A5C3ETF3_9BASI|nr:uncharacterized protein PFL1_04219 [Pseudozyma flocculosa PF-1]EPQ28392.1 hypothetical protein PFL1_04219 [Pseudozyma flocculosa PF-1]SPO35548.1 uncharacterized protein PSFLO_01019 [Pseudozyma flocculosa]